MPQGQKIYVHEHGTGRQLCDPVFGYILPRPGELFTFFDNETGIYTHCEVIEVSHGTNIKDHILVSSIQVKVIKTESDTQ